MMQMFREGTWEKKGQKEQKGWETRVYVIKHHEKQHLMLWVVVVVVVVEKKWAGEGNWKVVVVFNLSKQGQQNSWLSRPDRNGGELMKWKMSWEEVFSF